MLATSLERKEEEWLRRGIEKDIEKGMKNKAREDARRLKDLGVSIDIIAKATGLAVD